MKKEKVLQQQLYTLGFVVLSVKNVLDSSSLFRRPEWIDTLFLLMFFACIGCKFLMQKYTKPVLVVTVISGALFALVSFKMKYFFLLFTFCGIAASQNVNLKKVFRYTSVTKIIMILVHVVPYIITAMITPEQIDYIYRNGVQRQYFYIGHPNTFSMYVGWALLEFTYAFYEQLKGVHLIIIWCINFIVYQYTDSNTSIIVATICLILFTAERAKPVLVAKIITPVARYIFVFCSVFFTIITMWFTTMPAPVKSVYLMLNEFFTGRLLFGAFAYEKFGIAWLGNPSVHLGQTTYFEGFWVDSLIFDNSYIYLLVYYGAVFLPIFSIAFIIIGKDKELKISRNLEKILIIAYCFYAVMEQYAINAVLCFPVLFIGSRLFEIYEDNKLKKKEVKNEC